MKRHNPELSSIQIRILANTIEEIMEIVKVLRSHYNDIVVSGPFKNKFDPGYRAYIVFKLEGGSLEV
ncbi:MAG: hypothetical protein QXE05_08095 [Nitrososphaeria archaeon]